MERHTTMRKLVTFRTIDNITPIDGADKIECLHIGGWTIAEQKGKFYVGQRVFFFEEDSMLPLDHNYFKSLAKHGITKRDGKEYFRIRAIKLRGQVSQGLVFPYDIFSINWKSEWDNDLEIPRGDSPYYDPDDCTSKALEIENNGGDYSDYFGVIKYEPPIKFDMSGAKLLPFPNDIPSTDQERIQNFEPDSLNEIIANREEYIATEKLDGTSITIFAKIDKNGVLRTGVCSHTYEIDYSESNSYWKAANKPSIGYNEEVMSPYEYLICKCLETVRKNDAPTQTPFYVLQGELIGEKIQKNPLGVKGQIIKFFDLIVNGVKQNLHQIQDNYPELASAWVPIIPDLLPATMEDIVKQPNGIKTRLPEATTQSQIEGIVWRYSWDGNKSFKAISSDYLLAKGD